jgi:hypothetical protein
VASGAPVDLHDQIVDEPSLRRALCASPTRAERDVAVVSAGLEARRAAAHAVLGS